MIKIKEAQTINIPEARSFKTSPLKEKQKDISYSKLIITSPENDATIHSNQGNVSIGLTLEPGLNEKDVIVLFMDGLEVSTGRSSEFLLANIDRGTHTVYVAVKDERDKKDKVLKRSGKVVFHLRRTSILSPKPASAPDVNLPESADSSEDTNPTPASPNIPVL